MMMQFGDKNPADALKDPMWQMFRTFGQKADIKRLKEYVDSLSHGIARRKIFRSRICT